MEMIRCRGLFSVPTHARTQPRTGVLAYGNDSAVSSHDPKGVDPEVDVENTF